VDTLVDVFLGAVVVGNPIFPIGGADVSGRKILVKSPVVVRVSVVELFVKLELLPGPPVVVMVVLVKLDTFLPVVVVVVCVKLVKFDIFLDVVVGKPIFPIGGADVSGR
jgi:hypothetical protein